MSNIFIINVGANASHDPLRSPVFEDDTFEFIPIPERGRRVSCPECPTLPYYENLNSWNGLTLRDIIPKKYLKLRAHYDPEFVTFTYGDYPTFSPRAANLKKVSIGDFIVFLARLVKFKSGLFGDGGFFFVGFLEVEQILKDVGSVPEPSLLEGFKNNAHIRRAVWDPKFWDGFWVFRGSRRSRRFKHAVLFDREFCDKVLTNSKGERLIWPDHRSELQVIGSYTRACRTIEKKEFQGAFWNTIEQKGNYNAP